MNKESATFRIWSLAEDLYSKNPGVRRAEVIRECLKKGFPMGSVLTQVSGWSTARRIFTARGFKPGLVGDATATPARKSKPTKKAKPPVVTTPAVNA